MRDELSASMCITFPLKRGISTVRIPPIVRVSSRWISSSSALNPHFLPRIPNSFLQIPIFPLSKVTPITPSKPPKTFPSISPYFAKTSVLRPWRQFRPQTKNPVSGRRDSNSRPPGPKPGALTGLRYAPMNCYRLNSDYKDAEKF